jgi:hypothetical protein
LSVQNHILKSIHSAWIDELSEKFPDQKLELGLPKRLPGWGLLESTKDARICAIEAQGVKGFAAWGYLKTQKSSEMQKLAERTLERCIPYIKIHHQIELKVDLKKIVSIQELNPDQLAPHCTIWFPINVQVSGQRLVFDLGVGF